MKIVAAFEKNWSIAEVEDYIRNPNAEKYTELPDDLYLELVACAEYYATEHYCADGEDVEVDQHAMNESAALSIASGIEEYFFSDMYENYNSYLQYNYTIYFYQNPKREFDRGLRQYSYPRKPEHLFFEYVLCYNLLIRSLITMSIMYFKPLLVLIRRTVSVMRRRSDCRFQSVL